MCPEVTLGDGTTVNVSKAIVGHGLDHLYVQGDSDAEVAITGANRVVGVRLLADETPDQLVLGMAHEGMEPVRRVDFPSDADSPTVYTFDEATE